MFKDLEIILISKLTSHVLWNIALRAYSINLFSLIDYTLPDRKYKQGTKRRRKYESIY